MGVIVSEFAYFLGLACYLGAFFLALEWFVHVLPGSGLNSVRRFLFVATLPLLKWNVFFLPLKWGIFNTRGLTTAALLLIIGHYAVPCLVLFSFSLRG